MKQLICLALSFLLVLTGCASGRGASHATTSPSQTAMSNEEIAIGEQINAQILSSFYPYTEPNLVNYVNQIGNALASYAERKDLRYRFVILYNERIYATSAPGGYVYLTTGMLNFLENEAELAAVVAHEIGELQYKDPKLSQSKRILESLTRTGAAVGPAFGEIGALAMLGLLLVNSMAQSQQMTPDERIAQADMRGLHYMVRAGYDPQGLPDLLYRFLKADKAMVPYFYDYYQSRPISQIRMDEVQVEFTKLPLEGKTFSANREIYQQLTKGIRDMYGTSH